MENVSSKFFLAGILVGIFLGISLSGSPEKTILPEVVDTSSLPTIVAETFAVSVDDAIYGDRESEIVLIEYSDYDCPFCKRFHPVAESFADNSSNNISWVYRHNPLPIHPGAYDLSVASECVFSNLGNDVFWKLSQDIFDYGAGMSKATVIELAKGYGLTQSQVNQCFRTGSKEITKVNKHILQASSFGFSGTPNGIIFNRISGKLTSLPGAVDESQLRKLVRSIQ